MYYAHLKKVFSADRCNALLAQAQALGFANALVNVHGTQQSRPDIRQNSRLEWDNAALAEEVARALKAAAGAAFPFAIDGCPYVAPASHLRVYKYTPRDYFRPHKDGKFRLPTMTSRVIVLLYLNDTVGGHTVLMPNGAGAPEAFISIAPQVGDVLLFQHEMWHEGQPVTDGEKYVLRTDLFYQNEATSV